jgi:hypothetical protein
MALLTGCSRSRRYFRAASAALSFWSCVRATANGTVPAPPLARIEM